MLKVRHSHQGHLIITFINTYIFVLLLLFYPL